jgi:hypothetical protein
MVIAALPDIIGCVVGRLRSFNEILTFVTTTSGYTPDATAAQKARPRISGQIQSYWQLGTWPSTPTAPKGTWAIVVNGPISSPGDDPDGASYVTRVDLHLYGSSRIEAMRLYQQVHPCLVPRLHTGVPTRFIANGCRVIDVVKEGGPNEIVEPDSKYPKVVASYLFRWQEAP